MIHKDNKTIIFPINTTTTIIVETEDPLDELSWCELSIIKLIRDGQEHALSSYYCMDTRDRMSTIKEHCEKALKNELYIDPETQKQIGKLFAHVHFYGRRSPQAISLGVTLDNDGWWSGNKYLFARHTYLTWMYNDHKGNIVLECTTLYDSPFRYNKQGRTRYIDYHTYLDNYQTFFTVHISRETITLWLTIAEKYLQICEKNIQNNPRSEDDCEERKFRKMSFILDEFSRETYRQRKKQKRA